MAEKKKILYIVEAMGGGVFTYIVDADQSYIKNGSIFQIADCRTVISVFYCDVF